MEPQAGSRKLIQRHSHHQKQDHHLEEKNNTNPSVLRAPVDQKDFFSLELVEELLQHSRNAEKTCQLFDLSLPLTRESTRILSRIVQEAEYEECWPKEQRELVTERCSAPSALYILRLGMLRALGLPEPGLGIATDDAFLALGRDIAMLSSSAENYASEPLCYREVVQEDLRHLALGEWCEDLIFFTLCRGFSAIQTQCVLLTAMHLINAVAELPAHATDEDAEEQSKQVLGDLLVEQSCGLSNKVVEVHKVVHMVSTDVLDPEYVANIEAKIAKEKNAKHLKLLNDQLAKAPLVSQTRREVREKRVLAEIVVGPYFTLQEVAHILEYFSLSVVRHWRLFRAFLSEMQPVETHDVFPLQWDTWSFCVPPLEEFLREDVHAMEIERCSLMNACEMAIKESFDEEFMQPLSELRQKHNDLLAIWKKHVREAEEENIRNALNGPECLRVAHAFATRLNKCIERNEELDQFLKGASPSVSSSHSTQNAKLKILQDRGRLSRFKGVTGAAASSFTGSVSLVVPPLAESLQSTGEASARAVFSLEEVEGRVAKLEDAARAAQSFIREKPKKR